jgi:hypothetical protein
MMAGPERARRTISSHMPPKSLEYQSLVDSLKANHGLEKMQDIFSVFRLPGDLNLRTTECGMANAWYQRPTVTICYEYLNDIRKSIPAETTPQVARGPPGKQGLVGAIESTGAGEPFGPPAHCRI